ncbi:mannosyl-glycoprotein endo-beta-N-acetylglucosamidase [Bacillus sp. MM2020_1]|nr:mannosyl-glycoprotein endo-beta-N-acetylglucosamidase [Bacillus sp. MM2020_1]
MKYITKLIVPLLIFSLFIPSNTFGINSSHASAAVAATTIKETTTSKLGHIKSPKVKIYKNLNKLSSSFLAGSTYTDAVFYIKKQASVNRQVYYLLSKQPSSKNGVVGWVKSTDLSTNSHVSVDNQTKIFTFKGTGMTYSKAWGGKKDIIFKNLSAYKEQEFKVYKTEKVGNNLWYRGELAGKTVWIHSSHVSLKVESKTSLLGQIKSASVKIYKMIGNHNTSFSADSTYTNAVYYIKKQAKVNGQVYYLLSKQPSSEKGIVGWVRAVDVSTYTHVGVDNKVKTFAMKGTGVGYSKAWGGKKDIVYGNLSAYKDQEFMVNKTEKVGKNIWYRGVLAGKTVWIHSSHVSVKVESATSRLGHIRTSSVKIYKMIGVQDTSFSAGSTYTNEVYYIKKQVIVNNQVYYLLSKQPSSVNGVLGWVKASDLTTYSHAGVDRKVKVFYFKGTGSAYSKAWGGSKNLTYKNLTDFQAKAFQVQLTEKVGNSIWYRGVLNGKTVWIHESYLVKPKGVINNNTHYDLGLNTMVEIQISARPQTDIRYKLWIREDALIKESIKNGKATVSGDRTLSRGPGTSYIQGSKVKNGTVVTLYSSKKGSDGFTWYHVKYTSGWVTPDKKDLGFYLNSGNFTGNLKDSLQYLNLAQSANINVNEVNTSILSGKGSLTGKAKYFVDGAKKYGINEVYLISHALLETGNGHSNLANGIEVGKNKNGNLELATAKNRNSLIEIKKTYNMYGIGAVDACPDQCGAKYAYNAKWFTPQAAIIGGAAFIGNGYINNGQNTLYKMRWNPLAASLTLNPTHQYATDIGWAFKQTTKMYELYSQLNNYILVLDIPKYK